MGADRRARRRGARAAAVAALYIYIRGSRNQRRPRPGCRHPGQLDLIISSSVACQPLGGDVTNTFALRLETRHPPNDKPHRSPRRPFDVSNNADHLNGLSSPDSNTKLPTFIISTQPTTAKRATTANHAREQSSSTTATWLQETQIKRHGHVSVVPRQHLAHRLRRFTRDRGGDRSKTRLVIVNTPHNPTGRIYDNKTLKELAELLHALRPD